MGCDIHAFIEVKEYNTWWAFAELHMDRDYGFFCCIGNEGRCYPNTGRSCEAVLFPSRGVPKDASYTTKEEYRDWEGDAHSDSWLDIEEFKQIAELCDNHEVKAVMGLMQGLKHEHNEVRFVFWMDN